MDAKLNHSDLSALLARETNISGAKAEQFTKAMFDLIIEGLEKDGIVKINGLGTFKVTEVASRSSVNVNTGEKFEIKGHRKLTFTPADTLKDDVNQPFAMFEPVEVDESYKDDESEEEIIPAEEVPTTIEETASDNTAANTAEEQTTDIPTEEEIPAEDETIHPHSAAEIEEEQPFEEEAAMVIEETPAVITEKNDDASVEEETKAVTVPDENNVAEAVENTQEPTNDKQDSPIMEEKGTETAHSEKKGRKGCIIWTIAILLLLVLITIAAYIYFTVGEPVKEETKENTPVVVTNTEKLTSKVDSIPAISNDTLPAVVDTVPQLKEEEEYSFEMTEELSARSVASISMADTTLYIAVGEIAKHKVAAGDRLTRIAVKYYGDKRLWPYIVKYNRLANPNGLSKGMELAIPKLIEKK